MSTMTDHDALPAGTRLGEFEVQQVLGQGGFGIVYLAFDHALERQVAIKEFMPASLAGRGPSGHVLVRTFRNMDTFTLGMRSFLNEARLLARFDHPSLVKVYRFWEANGTAYMAMPFYSGRTLQTVRNEMARPPDEAWLRRLIEPLMGALACLHRENVFHRDVAPDNILLLDDGSDGPGQPVLLDLGAARRVIGDQTQAITAIVKPSFAPIEQYAETVQLRQGPWTDLYALAAVVHFCVTGRAPSPATARVVQDDLIKLTQLRVELARDFGLQFSESFVNAVDHALAVRPQDRPESVAVWREELQGIVSRPEDDVISQFGSDIPELTDEMQGALSPQLEKVQGKAFHKAMDTALDKGMAPTILVHAPTADATRRREAQAFMTTIPAANQLSTPPAWLGRSKALAEVAEPSQHSDASQTEQAAIAQALARMRDDAIPPTIPVSRSPLAAARPRPRTMASARSPAMSTLSWLRWFLVALAMSLILAVWWSWTHRGTPSPEAAQPALPWRQAMTSPDGVEGRVAVNNPAQGGFEPPAAGRSSKAVRDDTAKARGAALNPRKACGDRNFIMLAICMKQRCDKPEYATHSECQRMREQEAAQRTHR
jgi:serine/threonine protein kinase